uniref:TIR domain-containing protein n=2 Tax=Chrysotila carterae TaxID=13221 RepID=A0A7S4F686_CHRCT
MWQRVQNLLLIWHTLAWAGSPAIDVNAIVYSKKIGPQKFPNAIVTGLLRSVSSDELCDLNSAGTEAVILVFDELSCEIDHVCDQLLESRAVALLLLTKKQNVGQDGHESQKYLHNKAVPCVPYLQTAWLGDNLMQILAAGGELHAVLHIGSDDPWEDMYASVLYQIFLRWLPCVEYAVLSYGAGVLLWRLRQSNVSGWSTPRLAVLIQFLACLLLSALFGTGIYHAGESISWHISRLFITQLIGSSLSATILVGLYYRTLRLQSKPQITGIAFEKAISNRDPLYPKRRLVLAIAVACASSDLLLIPIVLVSDNEDTPVTCMLGIYVVLQLFSAILFAVEAHRIQELLRQVHRRSRSTSASLVQNKPASRRRAKYLYFGAGAMFGTCCTAVWLFTPFYEEPTRYFLLLATVTQTIFWTRFSQICIWEWPFSMSFRTCGGHASLESDRRALVALYTALGGDLWRDNHGWLSALPLERWTGVFVHEGRVVMLWLPHNNLSGELPSRVLNRLDALLWLDLSGNTISTSMDRRSWSLRLKWLDLSWTRCSNAALPPSEVSWLHGCGGGGSVSANERKALELLFVATGGEGCWQRRHGWLSSLPEGEWEGITVRDGHVVGISLPDNGLCGQLPEGSALAALEFVSAVNLRENYISGSLPASAFGSYGRMVSFDIARNELRGGVPSTLLSRGTALIRLALLSPAAPRKGQHSFSCSTCLTPESSCGSMSSPSMRKPTSPQKSVRRGSWSTRRAAVTERSQLGTKGAVLMDCCVIPVYAMRKHDVLKLERMPNQETALKQGKLWMRQAALSPFGLSVMSPAGSALSGDLVLAPRNSRAFYSHRWCAPDAKEPHPDDADNSKLKQLQMLLRGPQADVEFIWLDYWSVPQHDASTQAHVISALPYLVRTHGQFTALVRDEAGLREYNARGWCQLEQLASRCPYMGKQLETRRSVCLLVPCADTSAGVKRTDVLGILQTSAEESQHEAAPCEQVCVQVDEVSSTEVGDSGVFDGTESFVRQSSEAALPGLLVLRELPKKIFHPCTDGEFGDDNKEHVPPEEKDRHRLKDVCDKVLAAIALEAIDDKLRL